MLPEQQITMHTHTKNVHNETTVMKKVPHYLVLNWQANNGQLSQTHQRGPATPACPTNGRRTWITRLRMTMRTNWKAGVSSHNICLVSNVEGFTRLCCIHCMDVCSYSIFNFLLYISLFCLWSSQCPLTYTCKIAMNLVAPRRANKGFKISRAVREQWL